MAVFWILAAAATGFHGAALSPRAALPARRVAVSQVQSSKMLDQNMVVGGAVALLGSLGGVVRARALPHRGVERVSGRPSDAERRRYSGGRGDYAGEGEKRRRPILVSPPGTPP